MRRPAVLLVAALALSGAGVVLPAVAASTPACAEAATHAALVVDTGSQVTTYCVALDAPSVTGIHLIELASAQHGLQYSLGFGGKTVCQLSGVGPSGDDCWADYPNFWGYWRGDGAGGWSWSGTGAGSTSVGEGDMDGWSWGTGDSGSTHQSPPSLSFDEVCRTSSPSPPPSSSKPPPTTNDADVSASPRATSEPTPEPSRSKAGGRERNRREATPEVSVAGPPTAVTTAIAAARPVRPGDGPGGGLPIATVITVGVILILLIAGVLRLRRRSASSSPSQ